jgi:hypothetical protein
MNAAQRDARARARDYISRSIREPQWAANLEFTRQLSKEIAAHRFAMHPLIAEMNAGNGSRQWLEYFYLDTVHGLSGRFIEYLLQAMLNCSSLGARLGIGSANAARFLIQINALDELGFVPGALNENFVGDPASSHLMQLYEVMRQIGITEQRVNEHQASDPSRRVASVLECNRNDHLRLALLLAVLEASLNPWTACWARSTALILRLNTSTGYHTVHTGDSDGHLVDDDHSEDSWYVVRQALTPDRYEELRELSAQILEVCSEYADYHLKLLRDGSEEETFAEKRVG